MRGTLRKAISYFLLLCFLFSLPPPVWAASEPNPEGFRNGDRVSITNPGHSYLSGTHDNIGTWSIKANGTEKGQSLYFQKPGEGGGVNYLHPSTLSSWAADFNGYPASVTAKQGSVMSSISGSGKNTQRVHVRDMAELCGAHWTDSVTWTSGSADVHTTNFPSASLTVPINANPGSKVHWTIQGQSFVRSENPFRENKIEYVLKVNGTQVATQTLSAKTFTNSGDYTISSPVGSNVTFELTVTDGAGRPKVITKHVAVVAGAVAPTPPTPPTPEPPPPPPPPPNYDPKANFSISNSSPVEGQTVQLKDHSTHPGSANGETISSYSWTIQSGDPDSSTQKDVSAKWDTVGTYRITLTVEDQDGDSDSCTKSVVVGPALPAAVITLSSDSIILGREVHIDGDQSTAAMERTIKWDEMEWKIYNPSGTLAYSSSNRYPLGKGTPGEKALTNSVFNQTGNWTIKLKVKDSEDNESAEVSSSLTVYPDLPPIADFWLVSEALRSSYQGYELTVTDQSKAAIPDGALGDEIFQRTWTLYFDANNNGNYTVAGTDSAVLTQSSGNDSKPKIRFTKTGKYKLELTVRERATVWGTLTNGLTGDTSGKIASDKQVMVINLAPTMNFGIKKKAPVDIQFAADYTVSDSIFNNLQSAQAGFKGELEAASIDPVTGVQRVQAGELGQNFTNAIVNPYPLGDDYSRIAYSMGKTQLDTVWSYTTISAVTNREYRHINVETGQTKTAYYNSGNRLLLKLDDGTYWENMSGTYSTGITHMDRVNANLDVIVPFDTYNNAADASIPGNNDGWTYSRLPYTLYEDGVVYLIKGVKVNDVKFFLAKMAPNATVSWVREIGTTTVSNPEQVGVGVVHRFPGSNQYLVAINWSGYMDNYEKLYLVNPSSSTLIKQHTFMYHTPQGYAGKTSNDQYYIDVKYPDVKIYNSNGTVVANTTMPAYPPIPDGWYADRCVYIGSFDNTRSAAVFQNISGDGNKVDVRIILIDNSTGQIVADKGFHDDFYPGGVGAMGDYEHLDIRVTPVLPGILSIQAVRVGGDFHSTNERWFSSVVDSNLNIRWISPTSRYWRWGDSPAIWESFSALNEDTFLRTVRYSNNVNGSSQYFDESYEYEVFDKNCNQVKYYPVTSYSGPVSDKYKVRMIYGFPGYFLVREADVYGYRMHNTSGTLLWQKNYSEGVAQPDPFMKMIVLVATESGKPVTKLVNIATGNVINTIPHEYLWNNPNNILCYGIKADGTRDGTIRGFSQKQGLQYLNQVISGHSWDSQKTNFTVSIINGDNYKDFASTNASTISQLKANHLKLAVISPASGQTKAQGEYIASQAEGGWWFNIANNLQTTLSDLAQKIIKLINDERGADNIVLINEKVDMSSQYQDSENDPMNTSRWEFTHNPSNIGTMGLSNSMGYSALHGATPASPPTFFDKPGTYIVKARAQDNPVTNAGYLGDTKAGRKWSNESAALTVLAHRRPVASFTCSGSANMGGEGFWVSDSSYDPDLINTDPEGKKGLRTWEWQYRQESSANWISSSTPPTSFPAKGNFKLRLRVQDAHGAWSTWSERIVNVANRPPVASFEAIPNPVGVGVNCNLLDRSYDLDGDAIVQYQWTIQGIGNSSVANPVVSWPSAGDYTVTLRVWDSNWQSSTPYSQVIHVINNNKPVAVLTLPPEGYSDEELIANGTGSYDPDPGDRVEIAYWQYKKPGQGWSEVYTQHRGDAGFLTFGLTPTDAELGVWTFRLQVRDTNGLDSNPVEKTVNVVEGYEVAGYVLPNPCERGRNMEVIAYAHRKGRPAEKVQISSMTADIVYGTKQNGQPSLPGSETYLGVDMLYNPATITYRWSDIVPERNTSNRWSDDGDYYVRIVGRKNSTVKEALLPFSVKGHVLKRVYIKTRSW